ncbi:hypothetical protein Sjap_000776 [Stephania japonica]|uniref:Uncharacterized protein n=1 Tax=Stephania japonica TaxID=461633 RepID=A0AAP0PUE4_9MAGN
MFDRMNWLCLHQETLISPKASNAQILNSPTRNSKIIENNNKVRGSDSSSPIFQTRRSMSYYSSIQQWLQPPNMPQQQKIDHWSLKDHFSFFFETLKQLPRQLQDG